MRASFHLQCQRGKAILGEENDLIGESLPALFAAAGLRRAEVRLNDRVNPMVPPYESAAARALAEQAQDVANRGVWMWNRADARRYFIAGGGHEDEFEACWASVLAFQRREAGAIAAGRYAAGCSTSCGVGNHPALPEQTTVREDELNVASKHP
jgi:hypothetical protein